MQIRLAVESVTRWAAARFSPLRARGIGWRFSVVDGLPAEFALSHPTRHGHGEGPVRRVRTAVAAHHDAS